ncbi:MAG: PbsX family transcriptional regulator [Pseudomonadota bacterium]|nr:PbsX family transcriptional regulator [Pseudomonadota bacterium]
MAATVKVEQRVQEWGNGLGVRITAPVAKAARFARGLPVTVEVVKGGVFVRVAGKPKLTFAQKLRAFDPKTHGGEVMAGGRVGVEVF